MDKKPRDQPVLRPGPRSRLAAWIGRLKSWPGARKAGQASRYPRPDPEVERMFRTFRNASVVRPPD